MSATSLVGDIASAPGSPDAAQIRARFLALEHQFRHDNTIDPLAPAPGHMVRVTATSGSGIRIRQAALYYTTDGSPPSASSPMLPMVAATVTWDERIGYLTHWQAAIPGQIDGTIVRYRIGGWHGDGERRPHDEPDRWAHDGQGFWFRVPGEGGITTFAYRVNQARPAVPDWFREAVIYHIFVDRYHPGTPDGVFHGDMTPQGRHGGTLSGIRSSLPHIAALGATCLWLSPIHPSETHHRYDTMDYFGVDPDLGGETALRALVEEAHERGLRLIMDFVPSHCSWHHPAFLAAQEDRSSPGYSWFTFKHWPDTYRSFLQMSRSLPSLNTDDPGARAHLIASASYWVKEIGVDGFRLDHAIGPSMDFWVAFQTALESVAPDVVTVAEATDTPDSLRRYRGKLNSVLDFPLTAAFRLTFGRGAWGVGDMDAVLNSYEQFMADGPARVSFLDNHDMDRFLWVAGNDARRLRLAALCQFTLSATPTVYYGTEIGMTQERGSDSFAFGGDAEARRDMPWNPELWDTDLLEFYRRLIKLRRENNVLVSGRRRTIHLDGNQQTWAYARTVSNAGFSPGDLIVAINLGAEDAAFDLGRLNLAGVMSTAKILDATLMESDGHLQLDPLTAVVLRVQ